MKPYTLAVLSTLAAGSLWNLDAFAQFSQGDLMLGFRKPSGAGNDLVVDIGTAANLATQAAAGGGKYQISGNFYTASQFTASGINIDNLDFSVFGDNAGNTLWATANSTLNTSRGNVQKNASSAFNAISQGALDAGSFYTANPANSSSAVIMPNSFTAGGGTDLSYSQGVVNPVLGIGNFNYFQVANEAGTAAGFNAGTSPLYLNLYELDPSASNNGPAATQLGYFELDPNGSMSFNTGIAPVPEPSTWAMLGSGLLTLVAVRRIKNKN
jgi:PEP-CTERM motif